MRGKTKGRCRYPRRTVAAAVTLSYRSLARSADPTSGSHSAKEFKAAEVGFVHTILVSSYERVGQ